MACAGGTFALYSLLCRHANFSHLWSWKDMDEELSAYWVESITQGKQAQIMKPFVGECNSYMRTVLLLVVLLGTCMLIGAGVLTLTISGEDFIFVFVWIPNSLSPRFFAWFCVKFLHLFLLSHAVLSAMSGIQVATNKLSEREFFEYNFRFIVFLY